MCNFWIYQGNTFIIIFEEKYKFTVLGDFQRFCMYTQQTCHYIHVKRYEIHIKDCIFPLSHKNESVAVKDLSYDPEILNA